MILPKEGSASIGHPVGALRGACTHLVSVGAEGDHRCFGDVLLRIIFLLKSAHTPKLTSF
jgi:hypothetical protein